VFVPRGTPHCFRNVSEQPAKVLILFTPSGMEQFFDRFALLPAGPVDPATFSDLGSAAAMEVVGPPLS
jgi:hypothetical protein